MCTLTPEKETCLFHCTFYLSFLFELLTITKNTIYEIDGINSIWNTGAEKLSELEYKLKQIIQTEAQREKTEK